MKANKHLGAFAIVLLSAGGVWAQTAAEISPPEEPIAHSSQWSFDVAAFGYLVPDDQSYISPTLRVNRQWLHMEARYNYENQRTGSLWAGYNLSFGDKLVFEATPMLGAVFGNMTGIAPGYELSLTYKKIALSSEGEYVFDTHDNSQNFFYSWNELTYAPTDWFHAGLVSQRTRAYHTALDVQRGVSFGFAYRKMDFTTYVFNAGWTDPTVVLALGFSF